jgi:hypothetical protein
MATQGHGQEEVRATQGHGQEEKVMATQGHDQEVWATHGNEVLVFDKGMELEFLFIKANSSRNKEPIVHNHMVEQLLQCKATLSRIENELRAAYMRHVQWLERLDLQPGPLETNMLRDILDKTTTCVAAMETAIFAAKLYNKFETSQLASLDLD